MVHVPWEGSEATPRQARYQQGDGAAGAQKPVWNHAGCPDAA